MNPKIIETKSVVNARQPPKEKMVELSRRGFLMGAATLIGGILVTRVSEPLMAGPPARNPWVTIYKDFYLVNVPEGKTFANERFDKPVIFKMGERSTISNIDVNGYVNVIASPHCGMLGVSIDSRNFIAEEERASLMIMSTGTLFTGPLVISGLYIENNNFYPRAVELPANS